MSWLRAAVIKAVEAGAGGKDNLTRTVRSYAGTVVYHAGNAVVEGAKIIQDRIVISFSLLLYILSGYSGVWFGWNNCECFNVGSLSSVWICSFSNIMSVALCPCVLLVTISVSQTN